MRGWIKTAVTVGKIADSDDKFTKKFLLSQITGSNLILKNKKARLRRALPPFAALRAANKKLNKLKNPNKKSICHIRAAG